MQCRACTRQQVRSQSSSPPPLKRDRVDTIKSFSDGETSRLEEPYECGVCYLKFPRSTALDLHMQSHTDQLQFTCSYCPRLFKHKRSRDRHTKLHTGDKKYKCPQCESAFSRSDHLKIHMRTHDNRKPYKCETCSRGYNTAAALSSHQQSHIKTESCSGSRTSRSTPSPNVDTHLHDYNKTIYGDVIENAGREKLECMYCLKSFSSTDKLQTHVLKRHTHQTQNNIPPTSAAIQGSTLDHRTNGLINFSNGRRTILVEPTYFGGHTFSPYRPGSSSRPREYLAPTMRELNPKEGYPLQILPTDLSKKEENNTFESSSKKRKVDYQNISPSSSPYGMHSQLQTCICPCCSAAYPNFQTFIRHMESHVSPTSSSTLSICPTCGESSEDFETFTNHIFGHCIVTGPGICCSICKVRFDTEEERLKHYQDVHVIPVYRCNLCSEIIETGIALQMHFNSKHRDECSHCKCKFCPDMVFHDRTSAEIHVSMHHLNQYFPSQSTTEQFTEPNFMPENVAYQPPQPSIPPPFLFHSSVEPSENLKRYERTSPQTYSCDLCNLTDIPTEAELVSHRKLQHMKSKVRSVSLQCAYCNEICKSRNELENHMKSHQVMSGSKGKHKCNICDEIFTSSTILADHKLTHCKIVEGNTCVQCKAILSDAQSFYSHQLLHSNSPNKVSSQIALPANCVICCQTLQNNMELNIHANFHLKHLIKKYLCTICNDSFEAKSSIGPQNGENEAEVFNHYLGICSKCISENDPRLICVQNPEIKEPENTIKPIDSENDQLIINEKNNVECRLCKQVFTNPVELQIHLIEHNFIGMNQYSCYICSAVFTGATGLRYHIVEHGVMKMPYECTICQRKFYFRTELENHIFVHNISSINDLPNSPPNDESTITNSVKQYETCIYCRNVFLNNIFFNEHMKSCSSRSGIFHELDIDNKIKQEQNDFPDSNRKQ